MRFKNSSSRPVGHWLSIPVNRNTEHSGTQRNHVQWEVPQKLSFFYRALPCGLNCYTPVGITLLTEIKHENELLFLQEQLKTTPAASDNLFYA